MYKYIFVILSMIPLLASCHQTERADPAFSKNKLSAYQIVVWSDCPQVYTENYSNNIIRTKACKGPFKGKITFLDTQFEYNESGQLTRTTFYSPEENYKIIREYNESGNVISEKITNNPEYSQEDLKVFAEIPPELLVSDGDLKAIYEAINKNHLDNESATNYLEYKLRKRCTIPYVYFHQNGAIKIKGCQGFFNGMATPFGTLYEYDESGKLISSTYYHPDEFGKDYKIVKLYDKSGNVISEKVYKNDALYEIEEEELKAIPK